MDENSWALSHDGIVRHNKQQVYQLGASLITTSPTSEEQKHIGDNILPQEGDILGVAYDHIHLKYFLNGKELEGAITNCKGTLYPVLYVDDGAILDIILENFTYPAPMGFERIMLEQSLL